MFLRELPLRGAAGLMETRGCFWGSSCCAGLLDDGREKLVSGEAPAARGCSMAGGRSLFLGKLPLRAGLAARWREGKACFWEGSRCAGLLDGGREKLVSGEAPAARGCSMAGGKSLFLGKLPLRGAEGLMEGGRSLFLREFPLRGAAGLMEGGACFLGSSRCAGLLDGGREKLACFWRGEAPSRCAGLQD